MDQATKDKKKSGPVAALLTIAAVAVALIPGGVDLPRWAQTLATTLGLLAVAAPFIGQLMMIDNPASVWGRRLVLGGVWVVGFFAKNEKLRALIPVPIRVVLASLPEVDPADLPTLEAAAHEAQRTGEPVTVAVVAEDRRSDRPRAPP